MQRADLTTPRRRPLLIVMTPLARLALLPLAALAALPVRLAAADPAPSIGHTAFLGAGLSYDSSPGGGVGVSTAALMYMDPRAGGAVARMYGRASLSNAAGVSAGFGFRVVRGATLGLRIDRFEVGVEGETGQRRHEMLGGELGWIAAQTPRLVVHPVVFVERGTISGDDGATRLGGEVTALAPVVTVATLSGTPLRLAVYASVGAGQARLAGAAAAADVETRQAYLTAGLLLLDL